ncbi:hypothetical protein N5K35_31725 [Pseudomonas sp. GD03651]|jgi:hypothetical protein|uniref:hypothetical protein n=1 Tax=Pseudomonas TaxID=286 RepID=UPI00034F1FAC|nr:MULTISPECIES: hypothetical protein [Pseudomonas]PNB58304.1 hypothetical protein C1X73_14550 [Pseudomonas sp. FW305-130]AGN81544.1 hypothetical protein L483_08380 [Pseudomonas putida H8234]EKT4563304.1 hypothetical protein [Pseudomonas putida]MBH3471131.1 hypothetical protein [Pseudomonas putida]MDH2188238.1 hypothetical protein [Pseudomonas sp. GD03651]
MRILIGVVGLALLAGCATSPVPLTEAEQAPKSRVTGYQSEVGEGGRIIVTRDSGFAGAGCYATVFINGEPVARLNPKEKAYFNVPAGEWMVGAALEGKALCGMNAERLEAEALVKPGQTKKYRIYTSADGDVSVKPTTF